MRKRKVGSERLPETQRAVFGVLAHFWATGRTAMTSYSVAKHSTLSQQQAAAGLFLLERRGYVRRSHPSKTWKVVD